MACVLCASSNEVEFPSEIILHFPFSGLENLDKHGVFVYPKVLVCLDCGLSRFTTPETEAAALANGVGRQMKARNRRSVTAAEVERLRIA